jgi:hypothetical protein
VSGGRAGEGLAVLEPLVRVDVAWAEREDAAQHSEACVQRSWYKHGRSEKSDNLGVKDGTASPPSITTARALGGLCLHLVSNHCLPVHGMPRMKNTLARTAVSPVYIRRGRLYA